MLRITRTGLAILAFAAIPEPIHACTYPPPPIELPNENADAYQSRSKSMRNAEEHEGRRRFQGELYDQASTIELAIVRQSTPIPFAEAGGALGAKVLVEPVTPLKGNATRKSVTLADWRVTSCGIGGVGSATSALPGDYVVLFHGVETYESPKGFYGMKIDETRDPRILSALTEAAVLLRDGPRQAKPKQ